MNKKILKTILILGICMVFTPSAWAGDDETTAKKEPLVMMVTLPHALQWEKGTGSLNGTTKLLWNFSEKLVMQTI